MAQNTPKPQNTYISREEVPVIIGFLIAAAVDAIPPFFRTADADAHWNGIVQGTAFVVAAILVPAVYRRARAIRAQDDTKVKIEFLPRRDMPLFVGLLLIFALVVVRQVIKTPLPIGGWFGFFIVAAPMAVILLSALSFRPPSGTVRDYRQSILAHIARQAWPAMLGLLLLIVLLSIPAIFHLSDTSWTVFGIGAFLAQLVGAVLSIFRLRKG